MRKSQLTNQPVYLHSPQVIFSYLIERWDKNTIATNEAVYAVFLDHYGAVIDSAQMAFGDSFHCSMNIDGILKYAIRTDAKSIIIAHNHPTGTPNPSDADISSTEELYIRCKCLNITLADHIIVTPRNQWLSMKNMRYFDTYHLISENIFQIRKSGSFENICMTLIKRAFKKMANGFPGDNSIYLQDLNKQLFKVYTKFYDPII